jgi:hypothetical protein
MIMNSSKKQVAIFGVPRSGTSWLGQVFNSSPVVAYRYQPLFSYEFKGRINKNSTKVEIEKFYDDLYKAKSDFVLQKTNVSGKTGLNFKKKKTILLAWKEVRYLSIIENLLVNSETKVVLVVRHPCAVINSWARAPKEFDSAWDLNEEWGLASKKNEGKNENYFGYEKWKEAMRLFLKLKKEYPYKVLLVKYEDLVKNPLDNADELFNFADIPLEEQTKDFLNQSTNQDDKDPYGVFRKKLQPEKWKNELDPAIQKEILDDLNASGLAKDLGY